MARPKGKRQSKAQPPLGDGADPLRDPDGLRPRERLFIEYLFGVAELNQAEAYRLAGFKDSRHNAARLITRDNVKAVYERRLAARVQTARMYGDEALERISRFARADIRKLVDPASRFAKLPDEIALCIKSITPTRYGERVELIDPLRAAELLAKADGKLKDVVKHELSLEDIVAAANTPQEATK